MNEKIKELAEQATRNVESINSYHSVVFDKEKFAELIIKKVIQIQRSCHVNSSDRSYYEGWNEAIDFCNENIEDYFGVEE